MTYEEWEKSIDYVNAKISESELLAQLAEECCELAQAALKLRRWIDGKNPTPLSVEELINAVHEELADVFLCLDTLNPYLKHNDSPTYEKISNISDEKLARWVKRLEGKE